MKATIIVTAIITSILMVTPVAAASRGGHTVKYTRTTQPAYTSVDADEDIQYFSTSFEGDETQYWECSYR